MLDKSRLSKPLNNDGTLRQDEIDKFDQLAREWWDPNGKMAAALAFNNARLEYIESQIASHFNRADYSNYTVLDVGSGGGLISEPLAIQGLNVTGIDASAVSVEVARRHAILEGVTVSYRHALAAYELKHGHQYDIVINAEVVEHVKDQELLIKQCCDLVRPGGMLILATLNRTIKSFIIAILGAEYVMRYLPIGTHDWRYFVKPSTLTAWATQRGLQPYANTGMQMNPLSGTWRLTKAMPVNYCLCFTKPMATSPSQ